MEGQEFGKTVMGRSNEGHKGRAYEGRETKRVSHKQGPFEVLWEPNTVEDS